MGGKPYLVGSSIQAVMAQRLFRMLCTCKEKDPNPDPNYLRLLGTTLEEARKGNVCKPVGCSKCGNIGFKGRKAIFEMMRMNTEIRELAQKQATIDVIREAAIRNGMRTLVVDGLVKVLRGDTTPAEIAKHAQAETLLEENQNIEGA